VTIPPFPLNCEQEFKKLRRGDIDVWGIFIRLSLIFSLFGWQRLAYQSLEWSLLCGLSLCLLVDGFPVYCKNISLIFGGILKKLRWDATYGSFVYPPKYIPSILCWGLLIISDVVMGNAWWLPILITHIFLSICFYIVFFKYFLPASVKLHRLWTLWVNILHTESLWESRELMGPGGSIRQNRPFSWWRLRGTLTLGDH